MKAFVLLSVILFLAVPKGHAGGSCESVFGNEIIRRANFKSPYPDHLLSYRNYEVQNLSSSSVRQLNEKALLELTQDRPAGTPHRATEISFQEARDVLASIKKHPVLNPDAKKAYEHEDRDLGYCFGRAAYFHLLLLRMGLQKDSIRKVWIVGPMKLSKYGDVVWDYHVATVALTKEKGWVTIDTNEIKPEPVRDWLNFYTSRSLDGKARLYVTEASKLSIDTGTYDRVQLGLSVPREQDWFKGYFLDMFKSMRNLPLEDLGVKALNRNPRDFVAEENIPLAEPPAVKEKRLFGFYWKLIGAE